MFISVRKETPDGLDAIFEAYQQLKRLYGAATPASETCGCNSDENACPCHDVILLPGTNEQVPIDDYNELYGLELWLAEEVARRAGSEGC